jgi:hypothetical protein
MLRQLVPHGPHHRRHDVPGLGRSVHRLRGACWRANFFPTGIAHSIVGGSAWEPTPWRAIQREGWEASLKTKVDDDFSVVLAAASLLTLSFLV